MSEVTAIVLAAGQGTRMKSALPKVLHPLAGRPLFFYALRAALDAGVERVVVVTGNAPELRREMQRVFGGARLSFVTQDPPRGTGDAVRVGLAEVETKRTLILYADTPLIDGSRLSALLGALGGSVRLAFSSVVLDDPTGYGRVLRDGAGAVLLVREERDLKSNEERRVREVNAGQYAAETETLRAAVAGLKADNAQGEYYLTDVVASLGGAHCRAVPGPGDQLVGVNDRAQLRAAEERMFERIRERLGRSGVTVRGSPRIDDEVEVEPDTVIEAGCRLRGKTRVMKGAFLDVGSVLTDAEIGPGVILKPYSVVTRSTVRAAAEIGPFSHLRPDSVIEEGAHIGNFVETKKTRVRRGAKANHLSYLGDGDVGEGANIGAGTIFCNYDGFVKHRTEIGSGAFIGSDSQMVAPVVIGKNAYVATGTTVTEDVPEDALAIGRARQENKPGYAPRLRARLAAKKR